MTREQAINYLRSSGFSDEQIDAVTRAFSEERKTDTCKNAGEDYAECDQFVCSKCGIELQDWHSVERCDDGEIIYHDYNFRFCPQCGREIVEGGAE